MTSVNFENFQAIADRVEAEENERIKERKRLQLVKWLQEKQQVAIFLKDFFDVDFQAAQEMIVGAEDIPQEWTEPKHVWYLNIDDLPKGLLVYCEKSFDNKIRLSVATAKKSRIVNNLAEMVQEVKELQPQNLG